ncbi:MAG: hypothetical protein H6707_07970 [Deltaproteobacteria bacterium]|nr:hypothetical protein [Deltaproteobacteria bacterium]
MNTPRLKTFGLFVGVLLLSATAKLACTATAEEQKTEGTRATDCTDGIDNDGDGLSDCQDDDCYFAYHFCRADGGIDDKNWPTCASTTIGADITRKPVDIIAFVDTSDSMGEETAAVQNNLNAFAAFIDAQKVDYRVVLIADGTKICIAPPLGAAACNDGPRFRHIKQTVLSADGLDKILELFPQYADFLRDNAVKNFIAISDDDSEHTADWFINGLKKLPTKTFNQPIYFHSIVAFGDVPIRGCATGARTGSTYLDLTARTNGVKFSVCSSDWKPIFPQLAQTIIDSTAPECTAMIPDAPSSEQLIDLQRIWVSILGKGPVDRVAAADACQDKDGYYVDTTVAPSTLVLCEKTCKQLIGGRVTIEFGCRKRLE